MIKKMRPLKTGGFSLCSCPDEIVGKGRCKHTLGIAQVVWNDTEKRMKIVDMEGFDIKENDNINRIKERLSQIDSVDKEKQEKLLNYFKNFDM